MSSSVSCKKDILYLLNKYSGVVSKIETEILLEQLFNCERIDLYAKDFIISEEIENRYDTIIKRRLDSEPVQYITGRTEFMGFDFIVTPDTFIPRPETELIVQLTRDTLHVTRTNNPKILDLCTGCGNIAISLAQLIPGAEIIATDISGPALKIAEKNAMLHGVTDRVKFYQGNLFNALVLDTFGGKSQERGRLSVNTDIDEECVEKNYKFDIIICNPPYIKQAELKDLQKEVLFEPESSLNGGKDGLGFYRIIAEKAYLYLKEGGSLLMEMGFGQAEAVKEIFSCDYKYELYRVIKDFNQIDRVAHLKFKEIG